MNLYYIIKEQYNVTQFLFLFFIQNITTVVHSYLRNTGTTLQSNLTAMLTMHIEGVLAVERVGAQLLLGGGGPVVQWTLQQLL